MTLPLQIRVYRKRELCHTANLHDRIEIGRQRPGEAGPFHLDPSNARLIVAPLDDKLVSREHLQLQIVESSPAHDPDVTVKNLSKKRSVMIEGHGKLGPQELTTLPTPILVSFEDLAVRVEPAGSVAWELRSLEHRTMAPGTQAVRGTQMGQTALGTRLVSTVTQASQKSILHSAQPEQYSSQQLIHWLSETMDVLQSAAGASDFLVQAVDAVDRIVGLDSIAALRYEQGDWVIEAAKESEPQSGSDSRSPSRTILQEVLDRKCTVYHLPAGSQAAMSLQGVKALVASPILNAEGEVIGALYGARFSRQATQLPQISELEATMVEVIACSAAAGIARELQQQKALQARIQFEQFFTPQLARELESNPQMLEGQDREITVLFCDVVGFSSISGRIGSALTMEWISDVMDRLSVAVLDHDGVVVDYLGDELMAMWGAPKHQPDHAVLACRAAGDLMDCMAPLDAQWSERIGSKIDFRIGISSGVASVGNTGSRRRLKYGPLGNTVNLASRLQSAAKQLGVSQLISKTTADGVKRGPSAMLCRPLGSMRLVNIPETVEAFELRRDNSVGQLVSSKFQEVLDLLILDQREEAEAKLELFATEFPDDGPAQALRARLASTHPVTSGCIWRLDSK